MVIIIVIIIFYFILFFIWGIMFPLLNKNLDFLKMNPFAKLFMYIEAEILMIEMIMMMVNPCFILNSTLSVQFGCRNS